MGNPSGKTVRWKDDPARLAELPAVEAWCGWTFADRSLAVVALHPSIAGFSRLEFLGDTLLNLSVFTASSLAGVGHDVALTAVANASLDAVLADGPLDPAGRSGDVVETLVAAVYLDGGFDAAWQVSLRLVGRRAGLDGDPEPPPRTLPAALPSFRARAFVGSAVLRAAVADHITTVHPDWSQLHYSRHAASRLRIARLARLGRGWLGPGWSGGSDRRCVDEVQGRAADRFLTEGWAGAVGVADALGLLER